MLARRHFWSCLILSVFIASMLWPSADGLHRLYPKRHRQHTVGSGRDLTLGSGRDLFDVVRKGSTKRPEDSDELARRRTGVAAKYNQSLPYEIRLHYNESLEFYRRARQVGPKVQEYLNCVAQNARLYEKTGRVTSKATMRLVGQDITIQCSDCHFPGQDQAGYNATTIKWKMIPYDEPGDIDIIFDTEKFIFNSRTLDLTITELTVHDSARYRCVVKGETVRVYDVLVVENDRSATVFENSADGPSGLPSVKLDENNLRFYTHWDNWASCNECGVSSTRRRIGVCMVQKQNNSDPIRPLDYPFFSMFGWGLPCRSPLLPHNFTVEFMKNLERSSEVEIGHCRDPCPTLPPLVLVTDESGKIVDQYERTSGEVHNLDGPPKMPPLVQRETVYEEEGSRIRMFCPKGAKKSVRWQNCSKTDKGLRCRAIDPFHTQKRSQGRIRITIINALFIKRVTFWDAGIYSCYYDGRLIATTKIFVNAKRSRNWKTIITVGGIGFVVVFFLIGICYIIKNT